MIRINLKAGKLVGKTVTVTNTKFVIGKDGRPELVLNLRDRSGRWSRSRYGV